VRPVGVVEREVALQAKERFVRVLVVFQVHFLVLHRAPQPLDEDVIVRAALAVHADLHARFLEPARERLAGVLSALVGVEDLRPRDGQIPLQGLHAERRVERVRQLLDQHGPTKPVKRSKKTE